jgi:hypothetical protein
MKQAMRSIVRRSIAVAVIALIVAAYLMVLTRGGHLHWVLP